MSDMNDEDGDMGVGTEKPPEEAAQPPEKVSKRAAKARAPKEKQGRSKAPKLPKPPKGRSSGGGGGKGGHVRRLHPEGGKQVRAERPPKGLKPGKPATTKETAKARKR